MSSLSRWLEAKEVCNCADLIGVSCCLSRCLPLLKPYLLKALPLLTQQRWIFSVYMQINLLITSPLLPPLFLGRLGCLDTLFLYFFAVLISALLETWIRVTLKTRRQIPCLTSVMSLLDVGTEVTSDNKRKGGAVSTWSGQWAPGTDSSHCSEVAWPPPSPVDVSWCFQIRWCFSWLLRYIANLFL